ncbi:hypothetical protein P8848_01580 [Bacillus spizizenii]|uniref:hypothetical protein n=1 Tax=Bacillus subtilis TaxID=1423 RepID=UPI0024AE5863|nr:hypothetical protein [Bacillus subtilis]MDI6547303.1 hypothetical protein [Bacillus subtilis]MEC0568483.1 hypothetical protein [Bacillus spizizenii]
MVKNSLVEKDFKDGAKIIQKLDSIGFNVTVAFWLYQEESDQWALVLSSEKLRHVTKRVLYREVLRTLNRLKIRENINIKPQDIILMSPENKLIKIIQNHVTTNSDTLDEIKLSGTFDGYYIDAAYIYRVAI